MLAAVICNISGKSLKREVKPSVFMPDYLSAYRKPVQVAKTAEEQRAEMRKWYAMYKRKEAEAKGQKP